MYSVRFVIFFNRLMKANTIYIVAGRYVNCLETESIVSIVHSNGDGNTWRIFGDTNTNTKKTTHRRKWNTTFRSFENYRATSSVDENLIQSRKTWMRKTEECLYRWWVRTEANVYWKFLEKPSSTIEFFKLQFSA